MNKLFDITGKVVVITGGTGVLGKAIAKYLAQEGAKVVILGRRAEAGNAIVEDIKAAGGEAMFLTTDVMKQEVLEQNLADIVAAYGRVDSLLNAAGGNMPGATIAPDGTFFDLKPEEFQRVLDLNLTGTVIPSQVFLKQMVKQGEGTIVNFSSMAAFRPLTRVCGYAAAKAGISNFTAYMATEVAKKFGEGIFFEDAIDELFRENYAKALLELELEVIDSPAADFSEIKKGEGFTATITVACYTVVEVKDYKGVQIEKVEHPVTDEDVQKELEATQKRNAGRVVVEREAQEGDTVILYSKENLNSGDAVPV